jgi:hypothetical protein
MKSIGTAIAAAARGLTLVSLAGLTACGTPLIAGECAEGFSFIDGNCIAACLPGYERRDGYCRIAAGEVVVLGLDFAEAQPGDDAGHVLGNAVFLAERQPARVLDYRALSAWNSSSVSNTVDLIAAEALNRRRTVTTHVAKDEADVIYGLDISRTDVFLFHDASLAEPGQLGELGARWAEAIDVFLAQRGVVVVLVGVGGTNEMGAFLDASGLLHHTKPQAATGDVLYVADTDDMLSRGLPESLARTPVCASFLLGDTPDPTLIPVLISEAGHPVALRRSRPFAGDGGSP